MGTQSLVIVNKEQRNKTRPVLVNMTVIQRGGARGGILEALQYKLDKFSAALGNLNFLTEKKVSAIYKGRNIILDGISGVLFH